MFNILALYPGVASHVAMQNFFKLTPHFIRLSRSATTNSKVFVKMQSAGPLKAVVKTSKDDNRMEIKLNYVNEERGLDRDFSLNRPIGEPVQSLVERLNANIQKASMKYFKKLKRTRGSVNEEDMKLDVKLVRNSTVLDPGTLCQQLLELPDIELVIGDQVYRFDVDPPIVTTLKLSSSIMAGFPGLLHYFLQICSSHQ